MATNFSLVIQAGPNPGQRTGLAKDSFIIGRDPASDLHIQDIEVSRRHARLIAQSGGFVLEDLGSTNGTFVNGQRIRTITVLRPGDEIRLGEGVALRYELDLNSLETTPPSALPRRSVTPPPPTATLPPLDERLAAPEPRSAPAPEPRLQRPAATPAAWDAVPAPQAPMARPAPAARPTLQMEPDEADYPVAPSRLRPRRKGLRLSRNAIIGCAVLALLGACALTAFLWYVDANFLWCDVFGGAIAACR